MAIASTCKDTFYEAMGMMGVVDPMPMKFDSSTAKMPPLDKPAWFEATEHALLSAEAPMVGPQDSRQSIKVKPIENSLETPSASGEHFNFEG